MKINSWSATAFLLFRPSRLKEVAGQFNEHINRPEVQKARLKAEEAVPYYERSIDYIRHGLLSSFLLVLSAFTSAAVVGRIYVLLGRPVSNLVLEALQYLGTGILLWATLAKQGWRIETMYGATIPEVLNDFLYRALYVIGSFVLALSVTLQLASHASD